VLAFFWFYFNEPYWIAWIIGILILLIVLAKLFSGAFSVGKAGAKEFTRDMETDMMNANGKGPSAEYLTEVIKETGRQSGQALAPQDYTYKSKGLVGNLGQAAKNFWNGLAKIFRK